MILWVIMLLYTSFYVTISNTKNNLGSTLNPLMPLLDSKGAKNSFNSSSKSKTSAGPQPPKYYFPKVLPPEEHNALDYDIPVLNNPFKAPKNINVTDVTTNSATVCWQQPSEGEITKFQVYLNAKDDDSFNKKATVTLEDAIKQWRMQLCYKFELLEAGVSYEAFVVAHGHPYNYVNQEQSFFFKTLDNRKLHFKLFPTILSNTYPFIRSYGIFLSSTPSFEKFS